MKKTGVGLFTYNRPEFCKQSLEYVLKLKNVNCRALHDDCSDKADYSEVFNSLPKDLKLIRPEKNGGVAKAKNRVVKHLLDEGCDYIFLVEDDILIKDSDVLSKYIEASKKSGIEHFNFHAHGPGNPYPVCSDEFVTMWPNCVGAFSFYTRKCFEEAGLFDEHFINAWEHVEHTARIARLGLTPPFWYFADVTGSENWMEEITNSIENTSIIRTKEWLDNVQEGKLYWLQKDGIGLPPRLY